jgi:hypothetical protein
MGEERVEVRSFYDLGGALQRSLDVAVVTQRPRRRLF